MLCFCTKSPRCLLRFSLEQLGRCRFCWMDLIPGMFARRGGKKSASPDCLPAPKKKKKKAIATMPHFTHRWETHERVKIEVSDPISSSGNPNLSRDQRVPFSNRLLVCRRRTHTPKFYPERIISVFTCHVRAPGCVYRPTPSDCVQAARVQKRSCLTPKYLCTLRNRWSPCHRVHLLFLLLSPPQSNDVPADQ